MQITETTSLFRRGLAASAIAAVAAFPLAACDDVDDEPADNGEQVDENGEDPLEDEDPMGEDEGDDPMGEDEGDDPMDEDEGDDPMDEDDPADDQ
ncbi:hypothetical protein RIF23_01175 [Lipingzhangella sp. LS1_29]|uniref:DNA primase n=1 Tax=Lipingzhangella rawalii TaxID=2055835 RepID=A0ABU2H0R9_9ACTN|nr:hypothetical protein [Lipingzhangella rawalii]MDS1268900.1 hypothetical protein [Lipingzhangella rawalii]